MKKARWIGILTVCVILLMMPAISLAAVPSSHMDAFYINDFADVISAEDEAYMIALGDALEEATTAQLVAVTVNFLDGQTIDDYSYDLFNKWSIGDSEKNNGVLLLISVGDREIQTTVGIGLEDKLSASQANAYTDEYAIEYLAENDFSTGMRENYRALADKLASIYGVSLNPVVDNTYNGGVIDPGYNEVYTEPQTYYDQRSGGSGLGGIMGILLFIVAVVVVIMIVRSVLRSAGTGAGCLTGWMLGRGSARPRRRWGGWGVPPPPPPPRGPMGGGPRPPRSRPSGGRSTGSFGGGGFGGGSRPSGGGSRPRTGGGGRTRGGGSSRKF